MQSVPLTRRGRLNSSTEDWIIAAVLWDDAYSSFCTFHSVRHNIYMIDRDITFLLFIAQSEE